MAWDLEGLIGGLLVIISCAGEQGCSVTELLEAIRQKLHASSQNDYGAGPSEEGAPGEHSPDSTAEATVWSWLMQRPDVSLGREKKYNNLSLHEILEQAAAPKPSNSFSAEPASRNHGKSTPLDLNFPKDMRVRASEDTMWECIAGHGVDLKRVPRLEWDCLLGIASTKAEGILQGDLGRLVNQDKRSVPKRTDALLKKGHITKRTILVRGTKTSKMWLAKFAPALLAKESEDDSGSLTAGMDLSHSFLTADLEPVPWNARWTGESVDYVALATTLVAIVKAWGTIRILDLKAKLGVLGMRWQMKVLSKTCRFLNGVGIIQYVAAKLNQKVFKDCIQYIRDFEAQDWAMYLAIGRRGAPDRTGDGEDAHAQGASRLLLSTHPRWSTDEPLSQYIARTAQSVGEIGLTNPDIYSLTLGPSFTRFISTVTSTMASATVQPDHLKHLQLNSEHVRSGKVASYKYCIHSNSAPAARSGPHSSEGNIAAAYGFSSDFSERGTIGGDSVLSGVRNGTLKQAPRGRPRIKKPEHRDLHQPLEPPVRSTTPPQDTSSVDRGRSPPTPHMVVTRRVSARGLNNVLKMAESEKKHDKSHLADSADNSISVQLPDPEPIQAHSNALVSGEDTTLAASSGRDGAKRSTSRASPADRPVEIAEPLPSKEDESAEKPESDHDVAADSTRGAGRGRGGVRGRGRGAAGKRGTGKSARGGRGRGRGGSSTSGEKPWVCEKCGGSWKNDLGLKYHLEKSNSSCNPSYVPKLKPPRKSKLEVAMNHARDVIASDNSSGGDYDDDDARGARHKEKTPERLPRVVSDIQKARNSKLHEREKPRHSEPQVSQDDVGEIYSTKVSGPRRSRIGKPVSSGARTDPCIGQGKLLSSEGLPTLTVNELTRSMHETYEEPPDMFNLDPQVQDVKKVKNDDSTQEPTIDLATTGNSKAQQAVTLFQEEQTESTDRVEGVDSVDVPPVKTLSRAERFRRVETLIQMILSQHDGAFPGGSALWRTLRMVWIREYPSEASPTNKEFQASLRWLTGRKRVSEHWHAFRNASGSFAKCQIITLPSLDAFSTQSLELLEKMKAEHPKPFIPDLARISEDFDCQGEEGVHSGRRSLPNQVSLLSAPVYAAQIAAKREIEDAEGEERERKRQRKLEQEELKRERFRLASEVSKPGFQDSARLLASEVGYEPRPEVQFLDPNTYMEEEPPGYSAEELDGFEPPPLAIPEEYHQSAEVSAEVSAAPAVFVEISPIFQTDVGMWPNLDQRFFEDCPSSLTLHGWLPSAQWFSWESMRQEIDRRAKLRAASGRRPTVTQGSSLHRRFTRSLQACVEVEMRWTDKFVLASPGAAGPHNIFVPFPGSQVQDLREKGDLTWAEGDQFSTYFIPKGVGEVASSESSDVEELPRRLTSRRRSRARGTQVAQKLRKRGPLRSYGRPEPSKRVQLARRRLTAIPESSRETDESTQQMVGNGEAEEVLAAIVAIRTLLGGIDRSVDWGLLVHLFPAIGLENLRKYWSSACKSQSAYIARYMQAFYDKFLSACENDEIPLLNYDNPLDYDWDNLIRWTMELPSEEDMLIPSTQHAIDELFDVQDAKQVQDDWRERFFHPMASTYARLEAATAHPAALVADVPHHSDGLSQVEIARSWVRSVCSTSETSYKAEDIRTELQRLAAANPTQATLLQTAIDQLTAEKVIHKSKREALGGRPYRLTDIYITQLTKSASWSKYEEAVIFKSQLDKAFRKRKAFDIPYTVSEGAMMALLNMHSHGRIDINAVDVPHIPYGFEPGNYESRKFPKSYYHFGVQATPTATYEYSEDIETSKTVIAEGIPAKGPNSAKPQWVDIFGQKKVVRWYEILGAVCLVFSIRGQMSVDALCTALQPLLEKFEARLIMDWGKKTGVLKEMPPGNGVTVGEWWWLAIPWSRRLG